MARFLGFDIRNGREKPQSKAQPLSMDMENTNQYRRAPRSIGVRTISRLSPEKAGELLDLLV